MNYRYPLVSTLETGQCVRQQLVPRQNGRMSRSTGEIAKKSFVNCPFTCVSICKSSCACQLDINNDNDDDADVRQNQMSLLYPAKTATYSLLPSGE